MNKEDCIFCKIIKKDIPSETIFEDDNSIAFLSINPFSAGHTLVIPKNHSENILSIPSDDYLHVMDNVRTLANKIHKSMETEGINLSVIGEEVAHFHVHIIPRYDNSHPGAITDKKNFKDIANLIKE